MPATLENSSGYQGDAMSLPVHDVEGAIPFYERVMGFKVVSRSESPHRSALLARDGVQIGLTENGGDPAQDGCAFQVSDVDALLAEFKGNGLKKEGSELRAERRADGSEWRVFFVVAPDGLCYWFGQRQ